MRSARSRSRPAKSKDIKIKVTPPRDRQGGTYPVLVKVAARAPPPSSAFALQISGRASSRLDQVRRLSGDAEGRQDGDLYAGPSQRRHRAGRGSRVVGHRGDHWKVEFNPKTIASIAPNEKKEVQALVTPGRQGDRRRLCLLVPGQRRGDRRRPTSASRHHLDIWGIAGIGIIAVALLDCWVQWRASAGGGPVAATIPSLPANVIEARAAEALRRDPPSTPSISASGRARSSASLGPNGAGKTTTILMMLGLTETSGGSSMCWASTRCASRSKSSVASATCRTSVGFYDNLTARENLIYTARLWYPAPRGGGRIMEGASERPAGPTWPQARRHLLCGMNSARYRRDRDEASRSRSSTSRPRPRSARDPTNCWR